MDTIASGDGHASPKKSIATKFTRLAPLVALALAGSALFVGPVAARGPNGDSHANNGHANNGHHNGQNKDHANNGNHNGQNKDHANNGNHNGQSGDQPHDNRGTVKIHEGAGEPSPLMRNQPQVCEFHIHGFKFHASQDLTISIVGQGGANVAGSGTYNATTTTDANGEFRQPASGSITLADGMYKLTVGTGRTAGHQGKHKVFKIDCADQNGDEDTGDTPQPPGDNDQGDNPQLPGGDDQGDNPEIPGSNDQGDNPQQPGNSDQGDYTPQQPGTNPQTGNSDENTPVTPTKPGELPNTATQPTSFGDALSLYAFSAIMLIVLGGVAAATSRRRGFVRAR